jgi:peptidoglycan/LPS O-acetylase OafA/YrhL
VVGQVGASRAGARRGDIQGMRAVAVLLVLLDHAGVGWLAGGYVGVDVFFVISGFLITGILVRDVRRTGRVSLAEFYARRARRILPAASVVLAAIVLISSRTVNYLRFEQVTDDVVWAGFFAANIRLAVAGTDYFAADSFLSPVQHYWSLAVEEQFYLVWPALIALLVRGRGRRARVPRLRRLAGVLIVLCGLSLAWSVWRTGTAPASAYFSTLTRGWELGVGALLAVAAHRLVRLPTAVKAICSWAGLAAIGVAAGSYTSATPFPGYHALLPVVGAALVLAGGIDGPRYGAMLVLDRLPMRWIGDISYSLYLWHWPLLVLPAAGLGRELGPIERAGLVCAAIVVSWSSYRFVEMPVRRASFLGRRRVRSLGLWPAALALVLVAAAAIEVPGARPAVAGTSYAAPYATPTFTSSGTPSAAGPDRRSPNTGHPRPAYADAAAHDVQVAAGLARAGQPLPDRLRPSLETLWDDVSRPPDRCSADREATSHEICEFGDLSAKRTIALFGDSHIGMWMEPLLQLAQADGWKVVTFTKASCIPVEATLWRIDTQRPYTECDEYHRWAVRELTRIRPDRIILSGFVTLPLADRSGRPVADADGAAVFRAGAERMLRALRAIARDVRVISGTPTLEQDPRDCLAERKATMATCALPLGDDVADRNRAWQRASARTGARWVDVVPWFCDRRTCPVVVRDVIVYRDDNHISTTYASVLRAALAEALGR